MKPLSVDFVVRRRLSPWLAGAVALAALGWAGMQGWSALESTRHARSHDRQAEALRVELAARRQSVAASSAVVRVEEPYSNDAASFARMAGYDVGKILTSLESVQVVGARVVAVEIVPGDRKARIDVEFGDPDSLMKYLDHLNAGQAAMQEWTLLRVQAPAAAGSGTATLIASPEVGTR